MTVRKAKMAAALICAGLLVLGLAACTQSGGENETSGAAQTTAAGGDAAQAGGDAAAAGERGTVPYVKNDTVELGTYEAFAPAEEIEHNAGTAIEGNEEEELQQERIAGGAVGAVVSENLEPLNGIVDYSEGEYVPVYGVAAE